MPPTPATLGASPLDAPPPSPAAEQGMNPGMPLSSLLPNGGAQPLGAGQLPPEMLTGILQAGEQISEMLDGFAQALPDLAPDWAQVKESLMAAMAKVLQAGAGPTSPNAPGPNFPGGGFDRGGFPLASGG